MKCHFNRVLYRPEVVVMKNGTLAAKGLCPQCGTNVFRILESKNEISSVTVQPGADQR